MFRYAIVTLIGKHKVYANNKFLEYIQKVTIPPVEIVISSIPEIYSTLPAKVEEIPITGITGPYDEGRDRIVDTTSAREALRQYIIRKEYEWSLWLDNDILVPPNITERLIAYLEKNPELKMAHSFHPARQYGEEFRHGMGSSFVHIKLLQAYPFTYAMVDNHYLGDDQIWLQTIGYFVGTYYPNGIKQGVLFELKHFREDGTVAELREERKGEFI